MSRLERLGAWGLDEIARSGVTTISAVACLYREWRIAGREVERLSRALTRRHFYEGLRALDQACVSLRYLGEMFEMVARQDAVEEAAANTLRRELLAEILPWLEAARQELPAAAAFLCTLITDTASRDAAAAALRKLDEMLAEAGVSRRDEP